MVLSALYDTRLYINILYLVFSNVFVLNISKKSNLIEQQLVAIHVSESFTTILWKIIA